MNKLATFFIAMIIIPLSLVGISAQTLNLNRSAFGSGGMVGISNSNGMSISGLTGQNIITTIRDSIPGFIYYDMNQGFWVPDPSIRTDVAEKNITLNKDLYNYPNPVSTNTTIIFVLPSNSNISLKVYDMR